ncbi:phage tail protein [Seonamhaeicola marinus]|uniref:Phage tail protein n=1 Tax=Seonamhaeicola marinus TaxID=1912246 RepID=A0A5D0I4G9_9FLAO|nr:tail fiber protein [Seonamhaeicola marinus]TYA78564.1 phage tail protein [Seonamhaeicola marinus]
MKFKLYKAVFVLLLFGSISGFSQEAFIGEVRLFAGNFAPRGWAFCDGQLLSISSNTALFSILGTMYGGDGRTTFALPDLRGRVAVGVGQGPGLSRRMQGQKFGSETNTLTSLNLPSHNHSVNVKGNSSSKNVPSSSIIPIQGSSSGSYSKAGAVKSNNTGANQAVNNVQPSLGIRYIICLQGIFPSRS